MIRSLISLYHPSSLFCSSKDWMNPDFRDSYIDNLLKHLKKTREFEINIAMSQEFYDYFWENNPWSNSKIFSIRGMSLILHKMSERFEMLDSPPDTICQIVPDIENKYSEDAKRLWLILTHRLLFNNIKTLVIIGFDVEIEIDHLKVFCNCTHETTTNFYPIIKSHLDWYTKINYMEKCPENLDNWDNKFKLAIKMCREQEFGLGEFKTIPEDTVFTDEFKESFLDLQELSKRKRIIKSITKLLTLPHQEAGYDGGLREEMINGEFRIRISRGERIHYKEENGIKTFLKYYPSSKHDAGTKKK